MTYEQEAAQLWGELAEVIHARRWSARATLRVFAGLFLVLCQRCNENADEVLAEVKQAKAHHGSAQA